MRFEHDKEVNALYIYIREIPAGGVARTIELDEGVNLDVDAEEKVLGMEFVEADDFYRYLKAAEGFEAWLVEKVGAR